MRVLFIAATAYASNAWHTDEDCGCHNLNSAWGIRTMFERGYNASLAHRATDLKQLKDKSKQTKSEKKLKQALTYELWRSLRAYRTQQISTREEAEQEVVTCVAIKVRAPHAVDATCASVAASTPSTRRCRRDCVGSMARRSTQPNSLVGFHTGRENFEGPEQEYLIGAEQPRVRAPRVL